MSTAADTSGTPRNRTRVFRVSTGRLGHFSLGTECRSLTDTFGLLPLQQAAAEGNTSQDGSSFRRKLPGVAVWRHTWTWRDSNPHRPACKTGACPDSATGPSCVLQGSGGRIRTPNLLLNRELPVLLGFTGSCPDPRNRTPPASWHQVYGLADIPVSRSCCNSRWDLHPLSPAQKPDPRLVGSQEQEHHRKDSNPQSRLRRPAADPTRRRWLDESSKVRVGGFEPPTPGFEDRRSDSTELHPQAEARRDNSRIRTGVSCFADSRLSTHPSLS